MSVHIIKEGVTLCRQFGLMDMVPNNDTRWVAFNDTRHHKEVDCWRCICVHVGKPIPEEPAMPEHDKVTASNDMPQTLCEFVLEFLGQKDIVLAEQHHHDQSCRDDVSGGDLICACRNGELLRCRKNIVDLAAEFIGVDRRAYDREKDAALQHVRALNVLEAWALAEGRQMLEVKP